MNIENKLKKYIIDRYGSLRAFALTYDIPYTTIYSILNRGIDNASISSINRICSALQISADKLTDGEIVPKDIEITNVVVDVSDLINALKSSLDRDDLTLDGKPISKESVAMVVNALDISLEMLRRNN